MLRDRSKRDKPASAATRWPRQLPQPRSLAPQGQLPKSVAAAGAADRMTGWRFVHLAAVVVVVGRPPASAAAPPASAVPQTPGSLEPAPVKKMRTRNWWGCVPLNCWLAGPAYLGLRLLSEHLSQLWLPRHVSRCTLGAAFGHLTSLRRTRSPHACW